MTNPTPSPVSNPASRAAVAEVTQLNRDVLALWTGVVESGLESTFAAQNAALATSQTLFDTSVNVSKDAFTRWVGLARQAQATTLTAYQSSTRLFSLGK